MIDQALTCRNRCQKIFKGGLSPEVIGRLPVFAALEQLTVDDLVRILKEPRNALVKQYQTLLSYDNVELEFDGSPSRDCNKAIEKERKKQELVDFAQLSETMMDVMFEIQVKKIVKLVRITKKL